MNPESWLNGFRYDRYGRLSAYCSTHCVGCGVTLGSFCGVVSDDMDSQSPEFPKSFPFNPESCPVCSLNKKVASLLCHKHDVLTERLVALARARRKEEDPKKESQEKGTLMSILGLDSRATKG